MSSSSTAKGDAIFSNCGSFHSHRGHLSHDQIIGGEEGMRLRTSLGTELMVFRPTLADYLLEMPRQTQIIYPKDLGYILVAGDIYPGARVLEAGIGSGALTLALLRAVGEDGQVISYEVREDVAEQAIRNIESFLGYRPSNLTLRFKDIYGGIEEEELDRVILDVPEPWQAVASAGEALRPGGLFLSYLPTVLQIHELVQSLKESRRFDLIEVAEILVRPWHVEKRSVRPEHRMVAHTGFITTTRRCAKL